MHLEERVAEYHRLCERYGMPTPDLDSPESIVEQLVLIGAALVLGRENRAAGVFFRAARQVEELDTDELDHDE